MSINRASSFLEDKTFPINKLKRQKSKEILQYQHNNNKINNNSTINKDESDMDISSSDVSSINGKNEDTNNNYKLKTISQKNCFLKHDENFYLEPLRGKQKRPKFLLDFKILGLNNIPLFNENANNEDKIGVCYVKWSLLDHNHDHIFGSKKTSKNNVIYLRDYEALDFFADNKELQNLKNSPKNKNSQSHHQHHHQHGYGSDNKNDFLNMNRDEIEEAANTLLPKTDYMHPSGTNPGMYKVIAHNNSKGETKRHKIVDNYCEFNYQLESPIILKLRIDEDLIQDRTSSRPGSRNKITRKLSDEFMVIECYYELLQIKNNDIKNKKTEYRKQTLGNLDSGNHSSMNSSSTNETISISSLDSNMLGSDVDEANKSLTCQEKKSLNHKVVTRIKLGEVKINLTEYVHESEDWQTNFFLLQDSKVNSALKFSCHLKLVRGAYGEFDLPTLYTSGQLPGTLPRLYQNKDEIANTFERRRRSESLKNINFNSDFRKQLQEEDLAEEEKIKEQEMEEKVAMSSSPDILDPLQSKASSFDIHNVHNSNNESTDEANSVMGNNNLKLVDSYLLTTMKHKNFVNNFLRNPYEYDDPRDCVKDILEGKSGWNIDAIFTKPTTNSKNITQNTHEMGRLLDKYGSTQKVVSNLKDSNIAQKSLNSRIKTTGGWYFTTPLNQTTFETNVADYHRNDIWEEFDDSDIEIDEEMNTSRNRAYTKTLK